jgi:hypothetical protein
VVRTACVLMYWDCEGPKDEMLGWPQRIVDGRPVGPRGRWPSKFVSWCSERTGVRIRVLMWEELGNTCWHLGKRCGALRGNNIFMRALRGNDAAIYAGTTLHITKALVQPQNHSVGVEQTIYTPKPIKKKKTTNPRKKEKKKKKPKTTRPRHTQV